MTIFNIMYFLCLGVIILSFTNFGISYLSNYLHSNLMHDFRFDFKVNGDEKTDEEDSSMRSNFENISVNNDNKLKTLPTYSSTVENEDLPSVIESMREHLKNPEELRNIGNALEETVTSILSNDMLRKAFIEDFRGVSVEALHSLLQSQSTPKEYSNVEEGSNSDDQETRTF